MPAGGSTHTLNRRASPRAHLPGVVSACVCVSRHLTGACVSVSLCGGGANRVKERRGRDGGGEQQFIKPRFNAQADTFSVSGGGRFTTLQQSHYSVVKHGFNTHTHSMCRSLRLAFLECHKHTLMKYLQAVQLCDKTGL